MFVVSLYGKKTVPSNSAPLTSLSLPLQATKPAFAGANGFRVFVTVPGVVTHKGHRPEANVDHAC